jgi:hypothetical protein
MRWSRGVDGQEAVGSDRADLAHAVGSGDGLVLQCGFDLRFAQDDDRGGLKVEADTTGLDLAEQDRVTG